MARTDSIAEMLTMIRNAIMVSKDSVVVTASKTNKAIIEILKERGYLDNYREQDAQVGRKTIKVYPKYNTDGTAVVKGLRRMSRSGLRLYAKKDKVPVVLKGYGISIISTSKGLMTDKQAREQKIGGEVICYVW